MACNIDPKVKTYYLKSQPQPSSHLLIYKPSSALTLTLHKSRLISPRPCDPGRWPLTNPRKSDEKQEEKGLGGRIRGIPRGE